MSLTTNHDSRAHWRDDARNIANSVRTERARLKQQLRDGELTVEALIMDPPWFLIELRTFELLEAAPKIGQKKLRKLNMAAAAAGVNLFRPLGMQSERSRVWLAERLG